MADAIPPTSSKRFPKTLKMLVWRKDRDSTRERARELGLSGETTDGLSIIKTSLCIVDSVLELAESMSTTDWFPSYLNFDDSKLKLVEFLRSDFRDIAGLFDQAVVLERKAALSCIQRQEDVLLSFVPEALYRSMTAGEVLCYLFRYGTTQLENSGAVALSDVMASRSVAMEKMSDAIKSLRSSVESDSGNDDIEYEDAAMHLVPIEEALFWELAFRSAEIKSIAKPSICEMAKSDSKGAPAFIGAIPKTASRRITLPDTEGALVTRVCVSPDGKLLACALEGGLIRIIDLVSCKMSVSINRDSYSDRSPFEPVSAEYVAFDHCSKNLIVAGKLANDLLVFDCKSGRYLNNLDLSELDEFLEELEESEGAILPLSLAVDSKGIIYLGTNAGLLSWDLASGEFLSGVKPLVLTSDQGNETFCACATDAEVRIEVANSDYPPSTTAKVVNGDTARAYPLKQQSMMSLTVSPLGERFLLAAGKGLYLYECAVGTGQTICELKGGFFQSVVFLEKGQKLAGLTKQGNVRVYDTGTRRLLVTLKGPVQCMAASAMSPLIACGGGRSEVYIVNMAEIPGPITD